MRWIGRSCWKWATQICLSMFLRKSSTDKTFPEVRSKIRHNRDKKWCTQDLRRVKLTLDSLFTISRVHQDYVSFDENTTYRTFYRENTVKEKRNDLKNTIAWPLELIQLNSSFVSSYTYFLKRDESAVLDTQKRETE